jgi:hypothetical protein
VVVSAAIVYRKHDIIYSTDLLYTFAACRLSSFQSGTLQILLRVFQQETVSDVSIPFYTSSAAYTHLYHQIVGPTVPRCHRA